MSKHPLLHNIIEEKGLIVKVSGTSATDLEKVYPAAELYGLGDADYLTDMPALLSWAGFSRFQKNIFPPERDPPPVYKVIEQGDGYSDTTTRLKLVDDQTEIRKVIDLSIKTIERFS